MTKLGCFIKLKKNLLIKESSLRSPQKRFGIKKLAKLGCFIKHSINASIDKRINLIAFITRKKHLPGGTKFIKRFKKLVISTALLQSKTRGY